MDPVATRMTITTTQTVMAIRTSSTSITAMPSNRRSMSMAPDAATDTISHRKSRNTSTELVVVTIMDIIRMKQLLPLFNSSTVIATEFTTTVMPEERVPVVMTIPITITRMLTATDRQLRPVVLWFYFSFLLFFFLIFCIDIVSSYSASF